MMKRLLELAVRANAIQLVRPVAIIRVDADELAKNALKLHDLGWTFVREDDKHGCRILAFSPTGVVKVCRISKEKLEELEKELGER